MGVGMNIVWPDVMSTFKNSDISVVFTPDENYLPYVKVAINLNLLDKARILR